MPEENISTLLCYLEEGDTPYVKLDNPIYSRCKDGLVKKVLFLLLKDYFKTFNFLQELKEPAVVVHGDRVEEDGRDGGVLRPGLHFSALTGMDGETLDRLLDGKFLYFKVRLN